MFWGALRGESHWETQRERKGMQENRKTVLESLAYYMPKLWQLYSNLCLFGRWPVDKVS